MVQLQSPDPSRCSLTSFTATLTNLTALFLYHVTEQLVLILKSSGISKISNILCQEN